MLTQNVALNRSTNVALHNGVDTEGTAASPVDRAELQQAWVTLASVGGYHRGRVTSSWIQADGGIVGVLFKSGPKSCSPSGCLPDGGLPDGGNWLYTGVEISAYEVAEREPGAKSFDINLRFPGQYFDAETGKHENWNRYYDATTGRYLSPEPLLGVPWFTARMAKDGRSTPAYAYGLNNPLMYTDPNGLWPLWSDNYNQCFARCIDEEGYRLDPKDLLPLVPFAPVPKSCVPPFRTPIKSQPNTTLLSSLAHLLGGRSNWFSSALRTAGRYGGPFSAGGYVGWYGTGTALCAQECLSAHSVVDPNY